MSPSLSTLNHDRDIIGMRYIYPVLSRRAGGVSIGINFNINHACNWRCIYCQVPDLKRGSAPDLDFGLLEKELRYFLESVRTGEFFHQFNIPDTQRVIKDIAISGNGEPTSVKHFAQAVRLIGEIATQAAIFPTAHFVLISNGSLLHQADVQDGLAALASFNGELWFKLDSATPEGRRLINNCVQTQAKVLQNLKLASQICRTKLQTCLLHYREKTWTAVEKQAYLELLKVFKVENIEIENIMLYSLARQSFQPEAAELKALTAEEMAGIAADIKALGFDVSVNV